MISDNFSLLAQLKLNLAQLSPSLSSILLNRIVYYWILRGKPLKHNAYCNDDVTQAVSCLLSCSTSLCGHYCIFIQTCDFGINCSDARNSYQLTVGWQPRKKLTQTQRKTKWWKMENLSKMKDAKVCKEKMKGHATFDEQIFFWCRFFNKSDEIKIS